MATKYKIVKSKLLKHYVSIVERLFICLRSCDLPPPTVAILSNHMSTRNQQDRGWLNDIVASHDCVQHFIIDKITDVPAILAKCAASEIETLVVDGGDGTAGLVFSGLLNHAPYTSPPVLALLPSGKTNMTATAWSLSGDRRKALTALLRKNANGNLANAIHTQSVLTLHQEGVPTRHGAFFGGADVVEGILYCRKNIYPRGWPNTVSHVAAVAILFWRAMTGGKQGGTIKVTGEQGRWQQDGRFYVVMATTMDKMLLGTRPDPKVGDGPVHYISLRPGAGAVLSTVPNMLRRRLKQSNKRTVRRTTSVTLTFDGSYTLDGELYNASEDNPLTINGHQTLRFVRW
ncbi:MAG: diacylglycerol kinase family protein [Rhodospirillaceae bacterium]|nr:diacylglycerol kinase family protein [Rhodospirillaceae bacterium]